MTVNYNVTASGTLGTPEVLTGSASDLDLTLAGGSTCTGAVTKGSTCSVNVNFAPLAVGARRAEVEITNGAGTVLAVTPIYGLGVSTTGTPVAQVSTTYMKFGAINFGSTETEPLTVSNTGGGILAVTPSISTYSGGESRSYTIAGSNCGGGLAAGQNCGLLIEFPQARSQPIPPC
jgi:hypothetical protein